MIAILIMELNLIKYFLTFFCLISFSISQKYFGGELRTKESYLYGRFEARFKSAQGDGLVSSFFTYQDHLIDGSHIWNEIDFEILGRWNNVVSMNTITPGNSSHLRENYIEDFNPHANYHDYAFEWTPDYVAWFVDGVEHYRQDLPKHNHIATLKHAQKIMMNLWVPVYEDWVGKWVEDIMPRFAYYDHVSYYDYTPGSGNYGSNNDFKLKWKDDFNAFDSDRWEKATHTFSGNRVKFEPQNIVYKDGKMILCLTYNNAFGFKDNIAPTGLYGYRSHNLISLRFSEELDSVSVFNRANYTINNVQINKITLGQDQRTVHLSTNGLTENKTYRVSLSGIKDQFGNAQNNQILIIQNTKPANLPIKINVGGESSGDYLADKYWWYDYDDYGHMNGNHQKVSNINIKNTSIDQIYQSSAERIAIYKVRVVPGIYDITLLFAENYYQPNQRSFDVRIEGKKIINDLDVSKEVGMHTALEKKVDYVSIADGVLDIHFDLNLYGQGYGAAGPFLNGLIIDRTKGLGVDDLEIPSTFEIGEVYPNPFNNHLSIPIQSDINQRLTVDVVDVLGRQVDLLINDQLVSGENAIQWNAKNIGTGVYFIRAINNHQAHYKKVSLVK